MQLLKPQLNTKLKDLFRKIYDRGQIDLNASRRLLEEQLNLYLDHLSSHTGVKPSKKDTVKIWGIIERNNAVAKILSTPEYTRITKRKKALCKGASIGFAFCIDGRIPAIFLGGRFARHYEIPAAEITSIKRKSDNKLIPDSSDLNEALRRTSTSGDDLLEIVLAHTSLSDPHHGCGAMIAKKKAGLLDPELSLEEANLKIIKEKSIPAISNIYNEFREQLGLEPLKIVGISGVYDTDTFGIILNFELKEEQFSATVLTNKYKDELDKYFIKQNIVVGSFREKFTDLQYLARFSQKILSIVEEVLSKKVAKEMLLEIEQYLDKYFKDLTSSQRDALIFVLLRNIAFQYLTGSCIPKKVIHHPFSEHEESYMAVAMRGVTIGKFDPKSQVFASTPADTRQAIENIKTMLSIMGNSPKVKPYLLFICNSISSRDLRENNRVLQRIMGSNGGLLRDITYDKVLGEMIEKAELIPVPVLIEENSREVLKIVDHSGYI